MKVADSIEILANLNWRLQFGGKPREAIKIVVNDRLLDPVETQVIDHVAAVKGFIATLPIWPIILIDLLTEEGVVGRSYLEPYTAKAMQYLIPALHDFSDLLKGRRVAPAELHEITRKSLHFVGYQGLAMIAVSGVDMAAWDALAKAAGLPLCVLLGGTVGPVKAYNSNGLWLRDPEQVPEEAIELRNEGGFTALKLRLGREAARDNLSITARPRIDRSVNDSNCIAGGPLQRFRRDHGHPQLSGYLAPGQITMRNVDGWQSHAESLAIRQGNLVKSQNRLNRL